MRVPVYRIEGPFEDAYIDFWRSRGLSFAKAQERTQRSIQDCAEAGFKDSLISSITYFARRYATMYPERMRPVAKQKKTFTLAGFDPEIMQTCHVPGFYPGKHPLPAVRRFLSEMQP